MLSILGGFAKWNPVAAACATCAAMRYGHSVDLGLTKGCHGDQIVGSVQSAASARLLEPGAVAQVKD